jgi:hypothetical protein
MPVNLVKFSDHLGQLILQIDESKDIFHFDEVMLYDPLPDYYSFINIFTLVPDELMRFRNLAVIPKPMKVDVKTDKAIISGFYLDQSLFLNDTNYTVKIQISYQEE